MSQFNTKIITRELKTIPFDQCERIYTDAADIAAASLEEENLEKYNNYIARLEQEWADTHEAPYEGNFSDEIPYRSSPRMPAVRKKAGLTAIVEEFIPRYKLDTIMQTWIMPQVIAYISRKPLILSEMYEPEGLLDEPATIEGRTNVAEPATIEGRTNVAEPATIEGRKISGLKMRDHIFDRNNAWDIGLYRFLMLDQRSSYLQTQYKGEGRMYCSLVPLILYAFKLNHGIKYSQWSKRTLQYVVNESLCQAMLTVPPEGLTRDELLEALNQGLIYKTGAKAGQSRNPVTTYKLYDLTGTRLHGLPDLVSTMLTQIWCAHPKNRTKYMVLDPVNWDSVPTPLVTDNIFTPKVQISTNVSSVKDNPWD